MPSPPSRRRTSGEQLARCARLCRTRRRRRAIRRGGRGGGEDAPLHADAAGRPADGEGSFATFVFERARKHPGFAGTVGDASPRRFGTRRTSSTTSSRRAWSRTRRCSGCTGSAEDYSGAARTARGLADAGASLAERRRFLSLTKLSLLADGVASVEDDVVALDAALDLTSIQSNLSRRRGSGGDDDTPAPPCAW